MKNRITTEDTLIGVNECEGAEPNDKRRGGAAVGRRRLGRSGLLAGIAGLGLAATMLGATAAHADTLSNSSTIQLGNYPVPASPAAGFPGGNAIPQNMGTLGNPTELFVNGQGTANQVLSVPGGSASWGTPVATEPDSGDPSQVWRFQLVGYIDVTTPDAAANYYSIATPGKPPVNNVLEQAPVYKVINYNNGTHTCLDAYGGGGAAYTTIDSYGCDANQINQTNQLWVMATPGGLEGTLTGPEGTLSSETMENEYFMTGQNPSTFKLAQMYSTTLQASHVGTGISAGEDTVLENVASLAANGWNTGTAPVLSATVTNMLGTNSQVMLNGQTTWPVNAATSTWAVYDTTPGGNVEQPVPGSSDGTTPGGPPPACFIYQCLVSGEGD